MARTLLQLKQWAARDLHELETNTLWNAFIFPRWVNQVYNKILGFKTWHWNTDVIPLTWPAAAAGAEFSTLYLPEYIDKILSLYPGSTVGTGAVILVTPTEIDRWRPTSGRDVGKDFLVLHGYYGVEGELAANGVVTGNSSAGAPANQTILVEGLDANDRYVREDIVVPGGGAGVGAQVFKAGVGGVQRVTLIGDGTGTPVVTTGIITVTGDAGATNLFRCDSAFETSKEHQRTELYAVSSAQTAFTCRYYRRLYPVNRDQDVIYLPERFDSVMEYGLSERIAHFRQQAEMTTLYRTMFQETLVELNAWDNWQPGRKYRFRVRRPWRRPYR